MADRYGAGVTGKAGVNTADTVMFQIKNTSSARRLYVVQVAYAVLTAPSNALQPYLVRSSTLGTSSTTLLGQAFEPGAPAAVGTFDSAWSAAPTASTTNKIAVGTMAVTAGGGWIWDFRDNPLVIPVSAGLCIVSNAVGATLGSMSCSVIWDE